jgi:hypothetical protein
MAMSLPGQQTTGSGASVSLPGQATPGSVTYLLCIQSDATLSITGSLPVESEPAVMGVCWAINQSDATLSNTVSLPVEMEPTVILPYHCRVKCQPAMIGTITVGQWVHPVTGSDRRLSLPVATEPAVIVAYHCRLIRCRQ